jgi:hypothetical protein
MHPLRITLTPVLISLLLAASGCQHNVPHRTAGKSYPNAEHYQVSWSLPDWKESATNERFNAKHTTHYVEFDDQGDFWDQQIVEGKPKQLHDALSEVSKGKPRLHFIYCHGWKHTAISSDVNKFNGFLSRIARAIHKTQLQDFEVSGTYLAWRGAEIAPDWKAQKDFHKITTGPEDSQVGLVKDHPNFANWLRYDVLMFLPNQFSYWSRDATSKRMAGGPLSETINSICRAVRRGDPQSKVILIGHSMGAQMIEKTILQSISSQESSSGNVRTTADLVFLMNSAAPALYSKQLSDFFQRQGLSSSDPAKEVKPHIVSLTSESDRATSAIYPIGSWAGGIFFFPVRGAYRDYGGALGHQWNLEHATAGHTGKLHTHTFARDLAEQPMRISEGKDGDANFSLFSANLFAKDKFSDLSHATPGIGLRVACLNRKKEIERWSFYQIPNRIRTPYWIIQVPKNIINGHGDVWNPNVVNILSACLRDSGVATPKPKEADLKPSNVIMRTQIQKQR